MPLILDNAIFRSELWKAISSLIEIFQILLIKLTKSSLKVSIESILTKLCWNSLSSVYCKYIVCRNLKKLYLSWFWLKMKVKISINRQLISNSLLNWLQSYLRHFAWLDGSENKCKVLNFNDSNENIWSIFESVCVLFSLCWSVDREENGMSWRNCKNPV